MGWIGVDLDGTLAKYSEFKGDKIGDPIMPMVIRVLDWCNSGKIVKIMTARASVPELIQPVKDWCLEHLGRVLEVTNCKDFEMIALYDDRAIQVEHNTGRLLNKAMMCNV
jgi:hypothetical protein